MSIRSVWIISLLSESFGKVLFFRKFPTVEKRARKALGDWYMSIPPSSEFSICLFLALGLSHKSKQFVEWRDKASKDVHLPVISIKVKEKELWPLLIIQQSSYILCCLPFVEAKCSEDIFHVPSVSVGFSVLLGILNFLGPNASYVDELDERFMELDNYLSISIPFGTPSDTDSSSVVSFYNESPLSTEKQTYLKPLHNKAKSSIYVEINEYVQAALSDQPGFNSPVEICGCVNVKLESLSHVNEVNISLGHATPGQTLSLDSVIFHPCVQTLASGGSGVSNVPKKFWFVPALHRFALCFYTTHASPPPISGVFKMKGTTSVELLIQLKLNENVNNNFNFCEVDIPFFHRGPILHFDFKATQGFLHISDDKRSLKWKIGSKISSKSLAVFLTAKVRFGNGILNAHEEPFCTGKNSYIQVCFKKLNETLSGCTIDPKSVTVAPPQKAKIFIGVSVQTTKYVIWNSLGEVPFPVVPKDKWPKE